MKIYRRLLFFTLGRMYNTLWYQVRVMCQIRMIPGTYCIAICLVERGSWYAWHLPGTFRPTNSCIANGWWYAWYLRSAQETAVSLRVPYEVPFSSRCTTKSIVKMSPTGSLPPAVPLAITRTFHPWTHTSDDSYIYQLSLVVATATVSFNTASLVTITVYTSRMKIVSREIPSLGLCKQKVDMRLMFSWATANVHWPIFTCQPIWNMSRSVILVQRMHARYEVVKSAFAPTARLSPQLYGCSCLGVNRSFCQLPNPGR